MTVILAQGGAAGWPQQQTHELGFEAILARALSSADNADGMDLSAYQNETPPIGTQEFVWIRTTWNQSLDGRADQHYLNTRAGAAHPFAYHFLIGEAIGTQIDLFLRASAHYNAWAVDWETDPPYAYPTPGMVAQFIAGVIAATGQCDLYCNLANYRDLGQTGTWLANPDNIPNDVPAHFIQHRSGQPHGDYFIGTPADLEAWLGMSGKTPTLVVVQQEVHQLHLPQGITVYDTDGVARHELASPADAIGMYQVQVEGAGQIYWLVQGSLATQHAITLVRRDKVTDGGVIPQGGYSQQQLDAAVAAASGQGFAQAKTKGIAAVTAITPDAG